MLQRRYLAVEPVREEVGVWDPDWREAGYEDEFATEPWRHDWASWLGNSMSVGVAGLSYVGNHGLELDPRAAELAVSTLTRVVPVNDPAGVEAAVDALLT